LPTNPSFAKVTLPPEETDRMPAMQRVFSQGAMPYQQQRLDVKLSTLFLLICGLDNGGHYIYPSCLLRLLVKFD
jgi:hypothetical protein